MRIYTKKPMAERFWEKVIKTDGCWLWLGAISSTGYGSIGDETGRSHNTHKFSYELASGPVPAGLHVRHSCDIRQCVNPAHLLVGTHQDNMQDMISRGRAPYQSQTHCRQGHELAGDNLTGDKRQRVCKTCRRLTYAKHMEKVGGREAFRKKARERYHAGLAQHLLSPS